MTFQAIIRRKINQHIREVFIVLNNQDGLFLDHKPFIRMRDRRSGSNAGEGLCSGGSRRFRAIFAPYGLHIAEGQVEHKGGAFAHALAEQTHIATQQSGQLAGNSQPQTRATILATGSAIGLLERLKHQSLLLRRDTNT